jgi:hypothetical protein
MGSTWRCSVGVLAAVAIAGCGDGQADKITSVRSVQSGPAGSASGGEGGAADRGNGAGAESRKGSKGSGAAGNAPLRRVTGRGLSTAKRRNAAARITGGVLAQLALPFSAIVIDADGSAVTVAVPRAAACTATRADVPRIKLVVGRLIPFVKTVNVVVAGTRSSLAGYVASNCRPREIPSGGGRLVFDRSGAGSLTTAPITIRSRRWTVGYSSQAISLRVSVKDAAGRARGSLSARGRVVSRRTFTGPGTFRLRIESPAIWTVQVRDGG